MIFSLKKRRKFRFLKKIIFEIKKDLLRNTWRSFSMKKKNYYKKHLIETRRVRSFLKLSNLFCNPLCERSDPFPEFFRKINKFSGKNAVVILVLFASLKTAEYPIAECFIEILVWDCVCRDEFIKFFYLFYIKGMQKISFFCNLSYKYSIIC